MGLTAVAFLGDTILSGYTGRGQTAGLSRACSGSRFSLGLQEEERQALTLSLELEQQRSRALQEERDEARAGQLSEHRQLETLRLALEEERQAWAQQERQLQERCGALQEEARVQLEKEKVRAAVTGWGTPAEGRNDRMRWVSECGAEGTGLESKELSVGHMVEGVGPGGTWYPEDRRVRCSRAQQRVRCEEGEQWLGFQGVGGCLWEGR